MDKKLIATIKVYYDDAGLPHVSADIRCDDLDLQNKLEDMSYSDDVVAPIFNALRNMGKITHTKNYTQ